MPSLLSTMRYPDSSGDDELMDNRVRFDRAVNDIVWSRAKNQLLHRVELSLSIVDDPADPAFVNIDHDAARYYTISPYLLSQLAFTTAALDPNTNDALAAVSHWESVLTGEPLRVLTRSELMAHIDAEAPGFWGKWIDDATSVGIPLLGLESVAFDAGGNGTVTVRQWQEELLGWPTFADVPYLLGCSPEGADTQVALDECGTALAGTAPVVPVSGGPAASTFTASLTSNGSEFPVTFALLAGPSLLPGAVPAYGQHHGGEVLDPRSPFPPARTWMALCNEATTGRCDPVADSDGDGHPDWADCERPPGSTIPASAVYLLAPEAPIDPTDGDRFEIDANCDGWPTPVMIDAL